MTGSQARILVIADDLTGAAETAALLTLRTTRIPVARAQLLLTLPAEGGLDWPTGAGEDAAVLVVDLDTRHDPAQTAAAAVRTALGVVASLPPDLIFVKVDSLLRGSVAAVVAALAHPLTAEDPAISAAASTEPATAPATVVIAPSLPAMSRTVRNGILHIDGVPLAQTPAWALETASPPPTVAAALAPHPVLPLSLAAVRSGRLSEALSDAATEGLAVACDAETDDDLDAIVHAAVALPSARLVGSGGLAAALGRVLTASARPAGRKDGTDVRSASPAIAGDTQPQSTAAGDARANAQAYAALVVVGTAEAVAAEQVRRLVDAGATGVTLSVAGTLSGEARAADVERIVSGLRSGPTVVNFDAEEAPVPGAARDLVRRLADVVDPAVRASSSSVDLVLTGGETARRVLDAMGITRLTPVSELAYGAIASLTPAGRCVVTRPGSFGGPESLVEIVRALSVRANAVPLADPSPTRQKVAP